MRIPIVAFALVVLALAISELLLGTVSILHQYYVANIDSKTTGKIVRSELDIVGLGSKAPQRKYVIRYEFSVRGETYIGRLVNYKSQIEDAAEIVLEYPFGKIVTVYYDSNNPQFSILQPGQIGWEIWIRVVVIVVFIPALTYVIMKYVFR